MGNGEQGMGDRNGETSSERAALLTGDLTKYMHLHAHTHAHTPMSTRTSGTVPVSGVLVDVLCLGAVAGVKQVHILIVVAAQQLPTVMGVHQTRDVGTLHLTLRVHLSAGGSQ